MTQPVKVKVPMFDWDYDAELSMVAVDPASGKVVDKIGLAGHPESFQLEQQGARIYVNVPTALRIQVVDRERFQQLGRHALADLLCSKVLLGAHKPGATDFVQERLRVVTRSFEKIVSVICKRLGVCDRP